MNILWLSHLIPYPPKGGVLQRAHYLLREVARYHEVDLVAFNQPELIGPLSANIEDGVRDAKSVLGSFCHNVEFVSIESDNQRFGKYRLAFRSLFTKDPYTINWLKSGEFTRILKGLLESRMYDLVHFDTLSLEPYFRYIKGIPTVLDHHNIESHMLLRRADNENSFIKKWYFRQEGLRLERVEKEVCPKFSLNITCSEIDRDRLKDIAHGSWVEEVPNGVDIDYFRRNSGVSPKNSLIFVGTLSWYPNIEAVLFIANELWPKLKATAMPDISIDIIGANPPEEIRQLAKKDPQFRVHGFVDDIRPYMESASVYVCPITDGGGTKLKILDALSMSMAIVAHPVACEGIKVEDGKNVLFAESVDRYIQSIKKLLEDEELRRRMGKEARILIEEEYSYDKIGKNLSDLYEQSVQSFPKLT